MKSGGALLLVIVGLLALWIVVTGRLQGLQAAWATLQQNSASGATPAPAAGNSSLSTSVTPQQTAPPIYVLPHLSSQFAAAAPIKTAPVSNIRYGGG